MNKNFTDSEISLFSFFGFKDLVEKLPETLCPVSLYRMCMEDAFIHDLRGKEVEALRRACKALSECRIYRMTPEFEALIHIEKN